MAEFLIRGGKALSGEVQIAGSKNAVFPCIAASLLTEQEVILRNVPAISDVSVMIEVVRDLGVEASFDIERRVLRILSKNLTKYSISDALGKKFRGSILFAGALLGRMRQAEFPVPGGDKLGARPLEAHFSMFRDLGVSISEGERIKLNGSKMRSGVIFLDEPSVTVTENAIISSVLLPGKTEIRLAAVEPHIQILVKFLNCMGAKISWKDLGVLEIDGVSKLTGVDFVINPDELEVSGFATMAAATRSEILLKGIELRFLDAVLMQLKKMGVEFEVRETDLLIKRSSREFNAFRVQSGLYPKLMSDHIPPFAVLATQSRGTSMIHEWLYEGRLKYIEELAKMGAHTEILDPHRALITGPTPLKGANMISYDIRAGLTVVIAALVASGETRISGVEVIDRGYEFFENRLKNIGADIKRI
mgnify:CR=1 FL=1